MHAGSAPAGCPCPDHTWLTRLLHPLLCSHSLLSGLQSTTGLKGLPPKFPVTPYKTSRLRHFGWLTYHGLACPLALRPVSLMPRTQGLEFLASFLDRSSSFSKEVRLCSYLGMKAMPLRASTGLMFLFNKHTPTALCYLPPCKTLSEPDTLSATLELTHGESIHITKAFCKRRRPGPGGAVRAHSAHRIQTGESQSRRGCLRPELTTWDARLFGGRGESLRTQECGHGRLPGTSNGQGEGALTKAWESAKRLGSG